MTKLSRIAIVLILLGILLSAALPTLAKPYQTAPTNPGTTNLVACWDFNETSGVRYDYTANNYDLTDINTVGYTSSGLTGNATDHVRANSEYLYYDGRVLPTENNAKSLVITFYADALDSVNNGDVFFSSGSTRTSTTNYLDVLVGADGKLYINFGGANRTTTFSPSTSTWYMVVVTFDPANSNAFKVYVNNSIKINTTQDDNAYSNARAYFGTGRSTYVDGRIDFSMITSDVLTADEVEWLWNSGSGRTCSDLNPATNTPSHTSTNSNTPTFTFTPTDTSANTNTFTPSYTPSFTPSNTPTITDTPTPSDTPTKTSTPTKTFTPTETRTNTPGPSPTPTDTPTPSDTPTITSTPTATRTYLPADALTATYEAALPYYTEIGNNGIPGVIVMLGLCVIVIVTLLVLAALWLFRQKR